MRHYDSTARFYRSDDWANCKEQVIQQRMKNGVLYCEHCGRPIVKGFNPQANNNAGAIVFHHKTYLTNQNVNDAAVAINPNNIAILHWNCHNEIHERFGHGGMPEKKVYLVTGAPCSGKSTFVRERMQTNDIVLDIDDIWQTLSGQPRYTKPNAIKTLVFAVRDEIKGLIGRGAGTWRNAFVVESLPAKMDRQREAERYKAHNVEVVTMAATMNECMARLHTDPNGRNISAYEKYIQMYFERYSE